ncbi:hypothetical protein PG989_014765 [Apiospora arundinis]
MRCTTDPQIRIERYAKFAAAEATGKTGLLVQEVEPLGCRPRDDDIIREALQAMAEADARTMGLSAPPEFEPEPESEAPPPRESHRRTRLCGLRNRTAPCATRPGTTWTAMDDRCGRP